MIVARQSSRKRKITTMTMAIASASVTSTSRIESPTTVVESKAMAYSSPGGKLFDSSCKHCLGLRDPLRARWHWRAADTPIPCATCPLYFERRAVVFRADDCMANILEQNQSVGACSSG